MVDLAIAANFARELTAEQFAEHQRSPRRATSAGAQNAAGQVGRPSAQHAAGQAARSSAQRAEGQAHRANGPRRGGAGSTATLLRRTLSRLAQVRG